MDAITVAMGLAQVAPAIVRWLSGSERAGEAAEAVIDVARGVTGQTDASAALAAIRADPVLALQFRTALLAHEAEMDRMYLADRADARARDVALRASAGGWNWRADVLAVLAVGGLLACVWMVARDADLPERAVNAIMFVAGVLAAAVRDVFAFEFGSSRGSKEKDAQLARLRGGDR